MSVNDIEVRPVINIESTNRGNPLEEPHKQVLGYGDTVDSNASSGEEDIHQCINF